MREFWRLGDCEIERLIALASEADCVELKLLVPQAIHTAVCANLGVDLESLRARTVYFLDTPDRALAHHGMVLRVRSIPRTPDHSVVKLRPVAPDEVPARLRNSKRFVVEIDVMPGGYVCSGALKARLGVRDVERAMAGRRPLQALFSKRQIALFARHAPAGVQIDDLSPLGPVDARRRKVRLEGLSLTLLVERWTYPDNFAILELSTRCQASHALPVLAQTAAALSACGVAPSAAQQTKTRTTLDVFSSDRAIAD